MNKSIHSNLFILIYKYKSDIIIPLNVTNCHITGGETDDLYCMR